MDVGLNVNQTYSHGTKTAVALFIIGTPINSSSPSTAYMCQVSVNRVSIGSDSGLSHIRRQSVVQKTIWENC